MWKHPSFRSFLKEIFFRNGFFQPPTLVNPDGKVIFWSTLNCHFWISIFKYFLWYHEFYFVVTNNQLLMKIRGLAMCLRPLLKFFEGVWDFDIKLERFSGSHIPTLILVSKFKNWLKIYIKLSNFRDYFEHTLWRTFVKLYPE